MGLEIINLLKKTTESLYCVELKHIFFLNQFYYPEQSQFSLFVQRRVCTLGLLDFNHGIHNFVSFVRNVICEYFPALLYRDNLFLAILGLNSHHKNKK